jgi:hypothetical protein
MPMVEWRGDEIKSFPRTRLGAAKHPIINIIPNVSSFSFSFSELLPSDSFTPTLHLIAYSVNQKGRSEPTVLEDIAINEAEKRTGMEARKTPHEQLFRGAAERDEKVFLRFLLRHHSQHKFGCLQHCMKTHFALDTQVLCCRSFSGWAGYAT